MDGMLYVLIETTHCWPQGQLSFAVCRQIPTASLATGQHGTDWCLLHIKFTLCCAEEFSLLLPLELLINEGKEDVTESCKRLSFSQHKMFLGHPRSSSADMRLAARPKKKETHGDFVCPLSLLELRWSDGEEWIREFPHSYPSSPAWFQP